MKSTARRCVSGVIVSIMLIVATFSSPATAETLIVQGSTTFNDRIMAPYQSAIEAASKLKLIVVPNKSSLGLLALFEGRGNLAMISTSLESAKASLRKTNPDLPLERLHSYNIARTRIAFAVNPNNPVRAASLDTLRRVLLGEITNWKALGGPDLPIRIVMVREGGGVQLSVQADMLEGKHIAPADPIVVQIGTQVAKVVEQEPAALGLAQLGVLRAHRLPEILTDGVVEQQLNLVGLDEPTAAMQAVINATRRIAITKLDLTACGFDQSC